MANEELNYDFIEEHFKLREEILTLHKKLYQHLKLGNISFLEFVEVIIPRNEIKYTRLKESILEHAQQILQRGDIDLEQIVKILQVNTNNETKTSTK